MITDLMFFAIYIVVLLLLAYPLGRYIYKVFSGQQTFLDGLFLKLETYIYRLLGVNSSHNMGWKEYTWSLVWFNVCGLVFAFMVQMLQGMLPYNPEGLGAPTWHSAFNTAVSFITNTNWQSYAGEVTMSYWTQMTVLAVQNFVSAACGLTVAISLMRALSGSAEGKIGNFWVDLLRGVTRILLPLSIIFSLLFISQGSIQNTMNYLTVQTIEGATQTIPMGPVASQEAIKLLGTNGGGFFNANSAHPFENPTPISNFLQVLAILLVPTATVFAYGYFVGDKAQSYTILGSMLLLFLLALGCSYSSEIWGNTHIAQMGASAYSGMEGKETRFGLAGSVLFSIVTTAASCGAVNTMHDSLSPLAGMASMLQIMLGEVNIGGVGAGFYGMMLYVLLTVFIVGLMVGRTPEYLGKKIQAREIKMVILAILIPAISILFGSAYAILDTTVVSELKNGGAHGLSTILYAFASAVGNNGSAFAGLSADNVFFNIWLAIAMLIGRFGVILPVLAIAGSMAAKKTVSNNEGSFSTSGVLFMVLLSGLVLIAGALTFVPALALGPVIEYLLF